MLTIPAPVPDGQSTLPPQVNAQAPTIGPDVPVTAPNRAAGGQTIDSGPSRAAGEHPAEFTEFLALPQAPDELGRLGWYLVLPIPAPRGLGVVFLARDPAF